MPQHLQPVSPLCISIQGYMAYGLADELQGVDWGKDSCTKLHKDMSDAININEHCQGGRGALWHIFRRQDEPLLHQYLAEHWEEFPDT